MLNKKAFCKFTWIIIAMFMLVLIPVNNKALAGYLTVAALNSRQDVEESLSQQRQAISPRPTPPLTIEEIIKLRQESQPSVIESTDTKTQTDNSTNINTNTGGSQKQEAVSGQMLFRSQVLQASSQTAVRQTVVISFPEADLKNGQKLLISMADLKPLTLKKQNLLIDQKQWQVRLSDQIIVAQALEQSILQIELSDPPGMSGNIKPVSEILSVQFKNAADTNTAPISANLSGLSLAFRVVEPAAAAQVIAVYRMNAESKWDYLPAVLSNTDYLTTPVQAGVYCLAEYRSRFTDMSGHWAQEAVNKLTARQVVHGKTAENFEPDQSVTRAEFATLLQKALGLTAAEKTRSFSDVKSGDWFYAAVSSVAAAGIVNGYGDGSFEPNRTVSRQEAAAMLSSAMEYQKIIPTENWLQKLTKLSDHKDIAAWAKRGVGQSVLSGIIQGRPDHTFAPDDLSNRAEAVTMIMRYLEYYENMEVRN